MSKHLYAKPYTATGFNAPPSLRVVPNIEWRNQTRGQLILEIVYWTDKIQHATGWGAALVAADDWRKCAQAELDSRDNSDLWSVA